ncbi:MAG: phosphatase PAP2 family protein [Promethearchaeota archaeon]
MDSKEILNKISEWDKRIILKYNGFGGPKFTLLLKSLSFFGRETVWLLLIWYFFFIWYDPIIFSYLTTTFLVGLLIIAPVKKIFERPRPFETLKVIKVLEPEPTSRSFPSWHAYNFVSQGFLIIYLLNSLPITIIIIVLSLLIAFSRIQLGVHYPSDVIIGYFIGIIGFLLSIGILSNLFLRVVKSIEMLIGIEMYYRTLNIYLFENIGYLILSISIFILIILIASYKRIKERVNKL